MDTKRTVRKWEIIGFAVIASLGAMMHFVFEWSGELPPIGVIAPVNESVFEHLKMPYWPALFYAAIEYRQLKNYTKNFMVAKTASLFVMPVATLAIFYAYTTITGTESLIADIALFIVSVALGQFAGYKIMTRNPLPASLYKAAIAGLAALGIIYAVFTFYPPHLPIFLESATGTYGIP
ncbi:DUF6512 family protein [Chloroflexota bacterium]